MSKERASELNREEGVPSTSSIKAAQYRPRKTAAQACLKEMVDCPHAERSYHDPVEALGWNRLQQRHCLRGRTDREEQPNVLLPKTAKRVRQRGSGSWVEPLCVVNGDHYGPAGRNCA
jgi:hypothetical protein